VLCNLKGFELSMVRFLAFKYGFFSSLLCVAFGLALVALGSTRTVIAEEMKKDSVGQDSKEIEPAAAAKQSTSTKSSTSTATTTQNSFDKLVKDTKRIEGLLPLYRKEDKLYIEVPNRLLEKGIFCHDIHCSGNW
jgi:hypothetical protein